MLVGGMAAGTFLLVNGTAIAGFAIASSNDGEGFLFILLPIIFGIGLIIAGYRKFRYGEEVEEIQKGAKKAALAEDKGLRGRFAPGLGDFESGLNIIEELSELIE